jgi:hypothetical protein
MLNKYERVTLLIFAGITIALGVKVSTDFVSVKMTEDENREKQKQLKESQSQELMSKYKNLQQPSVVLPTPPIDHAQLCATNNTLPVCSMHVVPIDPTPAEIARQNSRLPR